MMPQKTGSFFLSAGCGTIILGDSSFCSTGTPISEPGWQVWKVKNWLMPTQLRLPNQLLLVDLFRILRVHMEAHRSTVHNLLLEVWFSKNCIKNTKISGC